MERWAEPRRGNAPRYGLSSVVEYIKIPKDEWDTVSVNSHSTPVTVLP